ncbi:TfoX/Sxy family DNA transformation protein [Vibrio sp. RE86]|uniref:TfoX/Sxy family DNA transformation protein n=1 Tax=Vibrio sp. RE86 TaxID=2607605 RepID=UPI0014935411|nr:TfoX/Sxy family DNA transformation protein [Vibrio sp. RE86]NOH80998.1 TfoX/Sxy family DNA transformation protein [Vibrio sp. RE86]
MNTLFRRAFTHLEPLGNVRVKYLFGVNTLSVDGILLLIFKGGRFYLRSTKDQDDYFQRKGYEQFDALSLGVILPSNFFQLNIPPWKDTLFLCEASVVIDSIKANRSSYATNPARLRDLPNIQSTTERLLNKAGIDSVDQLKNMGTLKAVEAISRQTHYRPTIELFWTLEGAIQGVHRSLLPPPIKDTLRNAALHFIC